MSTAQPMSHEQRIANYRKQNLGRPLTERQEKRLRQGSLREQLIAQRKPTTIPQPRAGDVTSASDWNTSRTNQQADKSNIYVVMPDDVDAFVELLSHNKITEGTYDFLIDAGERFEVTRVLESLRSRIARYCRQQLITYSSQKVTVDDKVYLRFALDGLHCE